MHKTNIVGERYGKLIVLKIESPQHGKSRCSVRCDCGAEKIVNIYNLKSGNTKTCGCTHFDTAFNNVDITGNRYGRLLVTQRSQSEKNRARWLCRCDCGNMCTATGKTLREGKKKSCGCIHREIVSSQMLDRVLPEGESACNALMVIYQHGAAKRNLPFKLTREQFRELTSGNCHYCNCEPSQVKTGKTYSSNYTYNGIDRVDNLEGYMVENCVSCCGVCNKMKSTMNQSYFINKCIEVVNNCKKSAEMTDSSMN